MERNRRIGKAYARVPIVTIDGSHELSYDGYKLALNGFDNPDRDSETDECRKRIGKGIRIKMDNFGNILIKRLSKSGIYIKEWINPTTMANADSSPSSTNGVANRAMPSRQQLIKMAAAGGGGANGGRLATGSHVSSSLANSAGTPTCSSSAGSSMESPNDSAVCDEVLSVGGRLELDKIYVMFDMKKFQANITQELCRPYPDRRKLEQQCFSIVGLSRDGDDILGLACWVMVINIVALEMLNERFPIMPNHRGGGVGVGGNHHAGYQPMSEMGGTRRSQPNFVSIFDHHHHHKEEDPYTLPANASSSDVKSSINDYGTTSTKNISSLMDSSSTPGNVRHHNHHHQGNHHQLPSRYYGASKAYARRQELGSSTSRQPDIMRHRSKSNYDIYGPAPTTTTTTTGNPKGARHERYNNSSSIYSPGHMLVPPPGDPVPPKLPPRDFLAKKAAASSSSSRSKSSTNVYDASTNGVSSSSFDLTNDNNNCENIYSVGNQPVTSGAPDGHVEKVAVVSRKAKKNRFLESLKAPLELAKSSSTSSTSNRSASVLGAPFSAAPYDHHQAGQVDLAASGKKSASSKTKSGFSKAKNLRSFLGVGSKSKEASDYVDGDKTKLRTGKTKGSSKVASSSSNGSAQADSVVDPNEDLDESQQVLGNSSSSAVNSTASYNDLDIPTPDYETDENIYALEGGFDNHHQQQHPQQRTRRYSASQKESSRGLGHQSASKSTPGRQTSSGNRNNKDDLYYSGFRAHIPKNSASSSSLSANGKPTTTMATSSTKPAQSGKLLQSNQVPTSSPGAMMNNNHAHHINDNNNNDKMSCNVGSAREGGRYLSQTSQRMMSTNKVSGRELIYGSTTGISASSATTGSRYRSASMQRLYPRPSQASLMMSTSHRSHNEMYYEPDGENPYGLIGAPPASTMQPVVDVDGARVGHYGVGGRRRQPATVGGPGARVASSMAAANYDIGRSSSGIYGNNSGSSSSDYADWHPQMRKVNSSGYLNSIFKHQQQQPVGSASSQLVLDPYEPPGKAAPPLRYTNNNNLKMQTNNKTSRTLKSMGAGSRPASTLAKQAHQVTSSVINGPAYRSYDSSNGKFKLSCQCLPTLAL